MKELFNYSTNANSYAHYATSAKSLTYVKLNTVIAINSTDIICHVVKPESEFPNDIFSLEQRRNGAIFLHFFVAIYVIEHICDEYFMPAIEYISFKKLRLSSHVAGATILAGASSLTELFVSLNGVFIAKNDISINTLLGSGSYNLLVIIGLCCFIVYKIEFKLDKYPIFRDTFFYSINLLFVFLFLFKNNFDKFYWYDSLITIVFYNMFMLINIFDSRIFESCERTVNLIRNKFKSKPKDYEEAAQCDVELAIRPIRSNSKSQSICSHDEHIRRVELNFDRSSSASSLSTRKSDDEYDEPYDMFKSYKKFGRHDTFTKLKLTFLFPARLIAFACILDFRRFEKHKNMVLFITLVSSALITGICTYMLIWMVVIICQTFSISETVVGFTFIAAATSMEETITSVSICKRELKRFRLSKGHSTRLNMVVSNCIGSNIFDISIGIGVPYLLNALFFSGKKFYTNVYTDNIWFIVTGLLVCLALFLILLMLSKFRLTRNFGFSILAVWVIYTLIVILLELNIITFFKQDDKIKRC